MSEKRVVPGEGKDSFLHHGALHIVIHENDVLLQDFHSKVQALSLQLCKQHLGCQNHITVSNIIRLIKPAS